MILTNNGYDVIMFTEAETPTGTIRIYDNGDVVSPDPHSRSVRGWAWLAGDASLVVSWEDKAYRFVAVHPDFVVGLFATPSLQKFIDRAITPLHDAEDFVEALV